MIHLLPITADIRSDLQAIENTSSIYLEESFEIRADVLDFIEVHILDRIDSLLKIGSQDELSNLRSQAGNLISRLKEIDQKLFKKLREIIRYNYTISNFIALINEHVNINSGAKLNKPGYDKLDAFIDGLFLQNDIPKQTKELHPDMVFYQKTPARIVFEIVKRVDFKKENVFYDLGSGLGQVIILINLLTGATAKGVELEPAFCQYANECVHSLNLKDITVVNADARLIDYSLGSVFFMYTPFKGQIMQQILSLLESESRKRCITLITYGPCTAVVAREGWLRNTTFHDGNVHELAVFKS